jgi:hypothetical protein
MDPVSTHSLVMARVRDCGSLLRQLLDFSGMFASGRARGRRDAAMSEFRQRNPFLQQRRQRRCRTTSRCRVQRAFPPGTARPPGLGVDNKLIGDDSHQQRLTRSTRSSHAKIRGSDRVTSPLRFHEWKLMQRVEGRQHR